MADDMRFAEWMVNCALNKHLGTHGAGEWFFDLSAHTALGRSTIKDLCGFDWNPDQWRYEAGLRRQEDIGMISPEDFRNKYWGIRPDFRFWADQKAKQLIVEGKGNGPGPEAGKAQAERYFRYLKDFQAKGAVVYLVPGPEIDGWMGILEKVAEGEVGEGSAVKFGVLSWNDDDFLSEIKTQLVLCIAESMAGSFKLLETAVQMVRGRPGTS